jgi:methionyl-tRNA formyltransferase
MSNSNIRFVFFGTSELAVDILTVLRENGLTPSLVVSTEDKPQGRGLVLSPTPTKQWAEIHKIPVYQPTSLKLPEVKEKLEKENAQVFIVASYGKLIPKEIFDLPQYKTLNVHPSLLPKLRGASPIQSAILKENETGVTIMQINEAMDEGPIIAQEKLLIPEWPPEQQTLTELSAKKGAEMLIEILPLWIEDKINPIKQDDSQATYTQKILKSDGLIDLSDDPIQNLRKVRALSGWPGAYIMFKKKNGEEIRVVIKSAEILDGKFVPTIVVPAGKKEMDWQSFLRGNQ